MNSPSDDKAFDEYLERRSGVSQAYRALPSGDVPAHLDRQILAQARAAIAGPADDELARVRAKRRRLMRWGVPAAIAASALLVVSIVIRSGVEHEVRSADFSPAAKPAPASAPAMPATQQEPSAGATAEESVVMIAPPRDAVTEFSSYARTPPRSERAPEQPIIDVPPVTAAAPMPAPPPPQPAVVAETEARAQAASRERELQQAVAARRQDVAKAVASAPAAAMRRSVAESANVADAALSVARLHADPDDWLEHIRQLRRDGQQAAADREWQAFQETYPDHPVGETDLARTRPGP